MKALVTGGDGFIGRRLVAALIGRGDVVVVVDSATGPAVDMADPDGPFDVVYHLAAAASVTATDEDHYRDTFMSTVHALDIAHRCEARRVVFTSSNAVYGDSQTDCHPISVYGACKLGAEGLVRAWTERTGRPHLIIRPGNVVGRGGKRGVILDTVRKLRRDPDRLEVLGDGTARKSFVLVDDLIALMLEMSTLGYSVTVDGRPTSTTLVRDVVHECCDALGVTPWVKYGPTPRGWVGDTTDAGGTGNARLRSSEEAVRIAVKEVAMEVMNG